MRLNYLKKVSMLTSIRMERLPTERKRAFKQFNCARYLQYVIDPETWHMFLNSAGFCNQRSCSVCEMRRCVKLRLKIFPALRRLIADYPDKHFLLLTLTVKNCNQSDLMRTLCSMQSGWHRLSQRSDFPAIGYLNSVELTRPRDCFYAGFYLGRFGSKLIERWKDLLKKQGVWESRLWSERFTEEVHPHFHVLMMVDASYFEDSSYIDHLGWVTRWRLAMNLDYSPVVDIRRVYGRDENTDKSLFEVTKYVVKTTDMRDSYAPFIFRQLHGLKLIKLAGLMADYVKQSDVDQIVETGRSGQEIRQFGVPIDYFWSTDLSYGLARIGDISFLEIGSDDDEAEATSESTR